MHMKKKLLNILITIGIHSPQAIFLPVSNVDNAVRCGLKTIQNRRGEIKRFPPLDPAQIGLFISQPSSLILVNKQQPCPTPTYLNAIKTLAARLTCKPSDTVMEEKGPVIR